jgi:selenoprotein W-related protein
MSKASGPRIAIRYCTQCHWLLRAAWMAQELLSTFGTDLGEVSLQPGTGGVFVITYDGEVIWERKTDGGFPDVKQLKQRIRDHLDPDRDLGHLDRLPIDKATGRDDRFHYAGPSAPLPEGVRPHSLALPSSLASASFSHCRSSASASATRSLADASLSCAAGR